MKTGFLKGCVKGGALAFMLPLFFVGLLARWTYISVAAGWLFAGKWFLEVLEP